MFDTFDISLSTLALPDGLELGRRVSAFGESDELLLYASGRPFARVRNSNGKTTLDVRVAAVDSTQGDFLWRAFLNVLVSILNANPGWLVTCESDCDQYPIERIQRSPEEFALLLDDCRQRQTGPIAIAVCAR